jgi:hypothetical protein
MAEKTLVDKAGETVGMGVEMAADVVGVIKAKINEAVSAVKKKVAKKTPTKKAAKKAPAKKASKKVVTKKAAKRHPLRNRRTK